ncbi:MAG: polysaccharide pyruvyl transferase family protein [Akkermansiaceae bacterium]|nr:polysaccharide pyruvyl transferase family protein [Akkermansiaceae bacterium]
MTLILEHIRKIASRWFIFGAPRRPIRPFTVNLLYWKPEGGGDNVGDLLSLIVCEWCLRYFGIRPRWGRTRRLCAVGSVLSFIGGGETTIWGTGLMEKRAVEAMKDPRKKMKLDIRAVRGPLTRSVLRENGFDCPEVYGDPAILMPLVYKPEVKKVPGRTLIIPHHSRLGKYAARYDHVADTYTSDWKGFIDNIASSGKVISSSLHGIILAESYGIPCVFLDDYPGSRFKYDDYFRSTGRTSFPIAATPEEGMRLPGGANALLEHMQERLLSAFPRDLF